MTTGQRIKDRRKALGLSAERVAELLGISPATIYRYEKGDIEKIPTDRLGAIAGVLQTTPGYLMGWEEAPATRSFPDGEILFALSGGGEGEITEAMYQEVVNFARFVAQREARKKQDK